MVNTAAVMGSNIVSNLIGDVVSCGICTQLAIEILYQELTTP